MWDLQQRLINHLKINIMTQFVNEALIKYNIMNEIDFLSNKIMHSELSNDEFFKTVYKIKKLKTML